MAATDPVNHPGGVVHLTPAFYRAFPSSDFDFHPRCLTRTGAGRSARVPAGDRTERHGRRDGGPARRVAPDPRLDPQPGASAVAGHGTRRVSECAPPCPVTRTYSKALPRASCPRPRGRRQPAAGDHFAANRPSGGDRAGRGGAGCRSQCRALLARPNRLRARARAAPRLCGRPTCLRPGRRCCPRRRVARRLARRMGSGAPSQPGASERTGRVRSADALARRGLPAPVVARVRLALTRGGSSRGVPVSSALVGVILAVIIIGTALTFSASLRHLFSAPTALRAELETRSEWPASDLLPWRQSSETRRSAPLSWATTRASSVEGRHVVVRAMSRPQGVSTSDGDQAGPEER